MAHSAVFQAGGLVVVLVEVNRKPYLASIVPVIVNAILNEHQIIVDIVAFVSKGDFPRSRLGEKQRGKILAGWVTRKLRTLAQFAIRDLDPAAMGEGGGVGGEPGADLGRLSGGSFRSGVPAAAAAAAGASSLRNVEHAPQILEQEELDQQMDHMAGMGPAPAMIGMDEEQPATPTGLGQGAAAAAALGTEPLAGQPAGGYLGGGDDEHGAASAQGGAPTAARDATARGGAGPAPPRIRLPGVDGREGLELWNDGGEDDEEDWTANAIMHMNLAGDMRPRQGH